MTNIPRQPVYLKGIAVEFLILCEEILAQANFGWSCHSNFLNRSPLIAEISPMGISVPLSIVIIFVILSIFFTFIRITSDFGIGRAFICIGKY